ncbi:MAG: hypothetical protein NW215_08225 [Hyphomicrobiales bacterium]|nr:hypothetical protein [Hyphomicrobiales bacterium]
MITDEQPSVIIGVTGHRNFPADDPRISALVGTELKAIGAERPGSPFLLLTGLAEGADRLGAMAARRVLDARIGAVIPLPRDLYEQDFADQASRDEYAALLAQSAFQLEAPILSSRAEITDYGEPRNRQYAWQGAYLAQTAQILIAIWDGAPARGTGGTAHVVDWFLKGAAPADYDLSRAERPAALAGVEKKLIHINPLTGVVEHKSAL